MTFSTRTPAGAPASAASAPAVRPSDAAGPPQSIRPFQPLSDAEREALLARFKQESGAVTAIRSKFTQTSRTALLVKPEISTGTLTFKKPMAFRYEYDNGNIFTLDRGSFTYYMKAQKQAGKIDLRRYDRLLGKYADPLGIMDRIGTDYQIQEAGRRDDRYRLKLIPGAANKQAKRGSLASVTLELTGTPLAIAAISVEMKNGDSLDLDFSTVEVNPVLPDDVFSVKIPPGVTLKESLPSNMNF
jgi:outer membrane lipoprotein-sorting protein